MKYSSSALTVRSGDKGRTILHNGLSVEKDSPPIETLGAIEELSSWIGVLRAFSRNEELKRFHGVVLNDLSELSVQIKSSARGFLSGAHVARIDHYIETALGPTEVLRCSEPADHAHVVAFARVACAVCRRAERRLLGLLNIMSPSEISTLRLVDGSVRPDYGLAYLNRLSTLLSVEPRIDP